jgi:type II restriction enzyme
MKFEELKNLYEKKKAEYGEETFKHISKLLQEAKDLHKRDWEKSRNQKEDHGQSWRAFKGKNLEKLVAYIIEDEVQKLGLKVVDGNRLERTKSENLTEELDIVKRKLLVDYGEFGCHLPDVDIIIYDPKPNPNDIEIIAVISIKVTLRERIAQTGYWKNKLSQGKTTKNIKVFFITPDEDKTLSFKDPAKKGRAIVEVDTDGGYVMSEEKIVESNKVKKFDKFLIDLTNLVYAKRNKK